MVSNREPEICDTLTIILLKRKNFYQLLTAYVGYLAEPEIWDKSIKSEEQKKKSINFWKNHALIKESR